MTAIAENMLFPGIIPDLDYIFLNAQGKCLILASLNLRLCISIWLHRHLEANTHITDIYLV